MTRPRYVAIFHLMKRLTMLSVVVLSAIFLMVGCGGSGSQAEQDHAQHKSDSSSDSSAKLELRPEGGGSDVSGTVSLEDVSEGVIVKLNLRELPKPNTIYLAHLHPGTCAEGE